MLDVNAVEDSPGRVQLTHRDRDLRPRVDGDRAEIDFRSPLAYGESVEISVGATSLGRSSFVLEADMHERATARLVAESKKVLVHYDFAAGRSAPLPDALRALILEQDPEVA